MRATTSSTIALTCSGRSHRPRLADAMADRLGAMRRSRESYSEVILRLVEAQGNHARRGLAG
jgi:hypothetical protein